MNLSEPREKQEDCIFLGKGRTYIYGAKVGTRKQAAIYQSRRWAWTECPTSPHSQKP